MPTQKLYEASPALRFTARVDACRPGKAPGQWDVVLDATAFFPEGGGQPCDAGVLGGAAVLDVRLDGAGVIHHTLDAPLPVGACAEGLVDAARRRDHAEQHTGEHILSGTLHRLYGAQNVGFHIGSPAVRMDIDRPLTDAQLAEAEAQANAVVRQNVPVRCWYPAPEELGALCYRSKKELDGPVRLVEVPGADLCACCGTHLETSGQVGLIKILSAQNYKGGVRLAVACGGRAVNAVAELWRDAQAAGVQLSAAPGAIAPAVERLLAARAAEKARLAVLQADLCAALCTAAAPGAPQAVFADGLDGDGLRRAALALAGAAGAPALALAPGGQGLGYALAGPGDVRPLCKALNEAFGGRGGGKAGFCQGSLSQTGPDAVKQFFLARAGQL